ncbi:hypothetical protein C0991_004332 [Blastosporella zonata]|nr:hypothetical protein C0991_004332 [Blastosporella zonata]
MAPVLTRFGRGRYDAMSNKDVPRSWPDHLDEAVRLLNWRLLPALDFSLKELLLGLVVNTRVTDVAITTSVLTPDDVDIQMAYAGQQRLDGYAAAVHHALKWKSTFDKRVLAETKEEVTFKSGDLVQVYRSDLDYTFKMDRKLLPKWSIPRRVISRNVNSYELEDLNGLLLPGRFSTQRLRRFWPRLGTKLDAEQKIVEERVLTRDGRGTGVHLTTDCDGSANGDNDIVEDLSCDDITLGNMDAAMKKGGHMERRYAMLLGSEIRDESIVVNCLAGTSPA